MAGKRNSTRTSGRARVNVPSGEVSKSDRNKISKKLKRTGAKTFLIAFVFLLIGAALGVGGYFIVSKDDCFKIVGNDEITITIDKTYVDEGVKVVSFNKDISKDVKKETNLKVNDNGEYYADEVGTYYVKYSSTDFKYGKLFKVEKVRLITVVESSEGGE